MTGQGRLTLAVAVLAAGVAAWAALPLSGASAGARPALITAGCCAALSVLQLRWRIAADWPARSLRPDGSHLPAGLDVGRQVWAACMTVPWPQLLILAAAILEVLHPARPWHTAALGLAMVAWLLVLHLAETGSRSSVFRHQLPILVAGGSIAVLAAAVGLLPATSAGSGWLTALAAVAALVVAGLALPV